MVSANPADAMGLSPAKGRIMAGADADFAILDMNAPCVVYRSCLATDAGYSVYEGQEMSCRVMHTMVRGRFAVRDGALSEDSVGTGRFIPRKLAPKP